MSVLGRAVTPVITRAGGAAALLQAVSYITGFGLFIFVLDRSGYEGPAGKLAFALDNAGAMVFAMIVLYLLFGIAQVVLSLAVQSRLGDAAPHGGQIATAVGLIWAGLVLASGMIGLGGLEAMAELHATDPDRAITAWVAIAAVQNGLGGGIEFVGGVWIALVSWLSLRARRLPAPMNWLGLAIGCTGIATAMPVLDGLVDIFGLGQIVWLTWLGIYQFLSTDKRLVAP